MDSVAENVGGFAAAGEDDDDGWIDRDDILQVAKEKEKELMVEMINFPKKNSLIRLLHHDDEDYFGLLCDWASYD
ncbi:hypothetical protein L6452_21763 [Arctium lappa]|uniref:Uncharacterized protein n=1 Tax=Arctium lappa TaxID=4217 RepID=A0ACB9AYN0_ARCLA|nr:hypothetical protein L6452_21763 [Arctium lappa]